MSDEILMYLPSNVDLEIFAENTRANYISSIPQSINLNEDWQVALQALNFDFKLPQIPVEDLNNIIQIYTVMTIENLPSAIIALYHRVNISLKTKYYTMTTLMQAINSTIPADISKAIKITSPATIFNMSIRPGILMFIKKSFIKWCYRSNVEQDPNLNFKKSSAYIYEAYSSGIDFIFQKPSEKTFEDYWAVYSATKKINLKGEIKTLEHIRAEVPKYIRVSCDIIAPIMTGQGLKCEIATLPSNDVGKSYFYELERSEYFPLRQHHIERIKIELKDHNFQPLQLASGQPTFATLKFKKMNGTRYFAMRLNSNASNHLYPANTNANFRIDLDYPINLDENWKVALTSIHFSNLLDYDYFLKDSKFSMTIEVNLLETDASDPTYRLHQLAYHVHPGNKKKIIDFNTLHSDDGINLSDNNNIIVSLGKIFDKHYTPLKATIDDGKLILTAKEAKLPTVSFDKVTIKEDWITAKMENVIITLSPELAFVLGATNVILEEPWTLAFNPLDTYTFQYGIDVARMVPHTVLLYCNIIKPVIIGPQYSEILRQIPIELGQKGNISYEPQQLEYLALNSDNLKTIQFLIKDGSGRDFQLKEDAFCLINLKFQRF